MYNRSLRSKSISGTVLSRSLAGQIAGYIQVLIHDAHRSGLSIDLLACFSLA
jgi:hypothetical protein